MDSRSIWSLAIVLAGCWPWSHHDRPSSQDVVCQGPLEAAAPTIKPAGTNTTAALQYRSSGSAASAGPAEPPPPPLLPPPPPPEDDPPALTSPDGMGNNGLSSASLFNNALTTNPAALEILRARPLTTATLDDPYLKRQLLDQAARDVMADVVGCALDRDSVVAGWRGFYGLCTGGAEGDWRTQAPSERCLQLVTACLLSRVNGLHRRVPISLHTLGDLLPLKNRVLIETRYRESDPQDGLSDGTPISGFADLCRVGGDCGWEPAHLGTCARNTGVQFTLQLPDLASCSATSLRVCKGIYGCSKDDVGVQPSALEYSGYTGQGTGCTINFTCPSEGQYGVMYKTRQEHGLADLTAGASTGQFPAPEKVLFSFREAAFFGDLFDPAALSRRREIVVVDGKPLVRVAVPAGLPRPNPGAAAALCRPHTRASSPYRNAHACYAFESQAASSRDIQLTEADGVTTLNDRVCAHPTADCFPNPVKPCPTQCTWDATAEAYKNCRPRPDARIYPAITTFLDAPCSLVSGPQCKTLGDTRTRIARTTGAPTSVPPTTNVPR